MGMWQRCKKQRCMVTKRRSLIAAQWLWHPCCTCGGTVCPPGLGSGCTGFELWYTKFLGSECRVRHLAWRAEQPPMHVITRRDNVHAHDST